MFKGRSFGLTKLAGSAAWIAGKGRLAADVHRQIVELLRHLYRVVPLPGWIRGAVSAIFGRLPRGRGLAAPPYLDVPPVRGDETAWTGSDGGGEGEARNLPGHITQCRNPLPLERVPGSGAADQSKWNEVIQDDEAQRIDRVSSAQIAERIREANAPAVVFAPSIGWGVHLFQRPQHLALALADLGHVVIFALSRAQDPVLGFKEIAPRLFLYGGDPAVLRGLPDLLIWTFSYNYAYRDYFYRSTPVVYDWIDNLEVFPYHQAQLRSLHERALRESAVVACVARVLLAEAQLTRPDAIYLPNAVEYERFAEVDPGDPAVEDEGLAEFLSRPGPLCGYYGALASWFDYKLLEDVAGRNPSWRFLLIGPDYDGSIRRARLKHHSNIYWAGPKDYRSLPGFLARFDVAMIPFVINDITRATSPLKLYEYFAGGKPVICTPMPECMAYPEVRIVTDASSFSGALGEARARGQDPVFRERLRELGRQNSWRARAEETLARFAEARASGSGARDSSVAP